MQKNNIGYSLQKLPYSFVFKAFTRKGKALSIALLCLTLQSCSYSAPNPADNIIGKNARQGTNNKSPRRAPDGNLDSSGNVQANNAAVRAAPDYDAYQNYQADSPPKKSKFRPVLNLKQLNSIMDREAAGIVPSEEEEPKIDGDADLQKVIKHNKSKKNVKKKKKAKLLVIQKPKKAKAPVEAACDSDCKPPVPVATSAPKALPAVAKPAQQNVVSGSVPAVSPVLTNTVKAPAAPVKVPSVPVVPVVVNSPTDKPIVKEAPVAAAAPVINPPVIVVAKPLPNPEVPQVTPIMPSSTVAPVANIAPATAVDIKNMSQQDIEKALKNKIIANPNEHQGMLDQAMSNPDAEKNAMHLESVPVVQQNNVQSEQIAPPHTNIPMPTLPAAMSKMTESSFASKISHLNELLITYYFAIKHFFVSLFSFFSFWK